MVKDARTAPGLRWMTNGQSVIGGPLLDLERRLDALFLRWASGWEAEELRFPTFIPAGELSKIDYLRSFPQLATFPVALDPEDANLRRFASGEPLDGAGAVRLAATAPVRDVLTPAACYHLYVHFQGEAFDTARYFTVRNTCFRREAFYEPLRRQWSFAMREIVCIGTAEEVESFLAAMRERVAGFFRDSGLPVRWEHATDPFFNPSRNPKYVAQKLEPAKTEMVLPDGLAIGSVNFHRDYFGDAFRIEREGVDASSGCVAFGLERWLYAWLATFGADASGWPDVDAVGWS